MSGESSTKGKRLSSKTTLILQVLVGLNFVIFVSLLLASYFLNKDQRIPFLDKEPLEIYEIKKNIDRRTKEIFYTQLIKRVGPVQAQEYLVDSGIPFDGEAHLLNHVVGEWLYKNKGPRGMVLCKDYFLSSCYHGFLIHSIADHGMDQLSSIMAECKKASRATAVQCSHAIGHGLLAWRGYANLPQALGDCDRVATLSAYFTAFNCYDGVFMENNWALHDDGKTSEAKWFKADNPFYPCDDVINIDEKYRKACWSNQPQMVYKDLYNSNLEKTADLCLQVSNEEYKKTCFEALARQITPLVGTNQEKVISLCNLMPDGWENECITNVALSLFGMGDRTMSFWLCSKLPGEALSTCHRELQYQFYDYIRDVKQRKELCKKIPSKYWVQVCSDA